MVTKETSYGGFTYSIKNNGMEYCVKVGGGDREYYILNHPRYGTMICQNQKDRNIPEFQEIEEYIEKFGRN